MKRSFLIVMLFAIAFFGLAGLASAAEKTPAQLLPSSTIFYMEINQPSKMYDTLLEHPLYDRLLQHPDVQKGIESNKDLVNAKQGLAAFEKHMGMSWRQALDSVSSKGMAMGIDPATKGVVILMRGVNPRQVTAFRDKLVSFIKQGAEGEGKPNPIQEGEYRGIAYHKIGQGYVAAHGSTILVTNTIESGQQIIDAMVQGDGLSLHDDTDFQSARATAPKGATGWMYLKVSTLRDLGLGRELFKSRTDNPPAELLFGGMLNALRRARYITGDIHMDKQQLRLAVTMPHDLATVPKARRFYFSPDGKGGAPVALKPDGTILNATFYRDMGAYWLAGPDLFTEAAATRMAQTDAQLGQFFAGRDFGSEILGTLEPEYQLIVNRQTFTKGDRPTPAIKLPGFALVIKAKKPELIRPYIQVAYTSIVTFANIAAPQQGFPVMMQQNHNRGKATLFVADYLVPPEHKGQVGAGINYNFSPTFVTHDNHMVLASNKQIGEQLADLLSKPAANAKSSDNSNITINPQVAAVALRDNRDQLIAQNMLKKGITKEASASEIDLVIDAISQLRLVDVKITPQPKALRLELGVGFNESK